MFKRIFVLFVCVQIQGQILASVPEPQSDDIIISIIKNDGYPAELYDVTTKDGYILGLYRIPSKNLTSKVVFAMHGMLCSAVDFLVLGPGENKALAYALSDAGYDVWLGNARGTKFSKRHVQFNANNDEFWEFSWNEIGKYDVPAFIDTVLTKTGQKSLHYVGHSQGTTTFFVMLSNLPKYNEKIRSFHGMTPVMFIKNPSPLTQLLAANVEEIEMALAMFSIYEFPTGMTEVENLATLFCKEEMPFAVLCANLIFAFVGKNPEQFNGTLLGPVLKNTPAGISFRQLFHYLQLANSDGKFQHYDFKAEKNLEQYKTLTPPEYQTDNIKVKMQILYGTHDLLITPKDVELLIHKFDNQIVDVVKMDNWTHIDFIYGKEANKMIYQKIIDVMKRYEI